MILTMIFFHTCSSSGVQDDAQLLVSSEEFSAWKGAPNGLKALFPVRSSLEGVLRAFPGLNEKLSSNL